MVIPPGAIETTDDPAVAGQIEQALRATLALINRQSVNDSRTFCLRDREGQLVAGLTCSTSYGWLHVETLWVSDVHRAKGLGRQLMHAAEAFAREQGCHSAWLESSNPGALAFYRQRGYEVFGELVNGEGRHPAEHRRWFLRRTLPKTAATG